MKHISIIQNQAKKIVINCQIQMKVMMKLMLFSVQSRLRPNVVVVVDDNEDDEYVPGQQVNHYLDGNKLFDTIVNTEEQINVLSEREGEEVGYFQGAKCYI